MSAKHGGQAFPSTEYSDERPVGNEPGMTLRDWLAGQAIAGTVVQPWGEQGLKWEVELAERAYAIADAMLAARSKGGAS